MTEMTQSFLKLLFNEGETICVSPYNAGYHSVEQTALNGDIYLISPNEEKAPIMIHEKDINLVAINPIKGYKRDENVTAFRSFLIECDTETLEEQKRYVDESGLPYSLCVYSGNKSLHFGIVLDEALPSASVWKWFNQWILNILTKADQQVKSPSRAIRFPGNQRKNGKKLVQSLVIINGRVKLEVFFKWIYQFEDKKPKKEKKFAQGSVYHGALDVSKIPKDLKDRLKESITEDRNATWFKLAFRLSKIGFDIQQLTTYLEQFFQEESDFKRREWEACIKSAHKIAQDNI
jgi:hypothetical protein